MSVNDLKDSIRGKRASVNEMLAGPNRCADSDLSVIDTVILIVSDLHLQNLCAIPVSDAPTMI